MTAAKPELRSAITCPRCAHRQVDEMPTDACQFFYECAGHDLIPEAGHRAGIFFEGLRQLPRSSRSRADAAAQNSPLHNAQ